MKSDLTYLLNFKKHIKLKNVPQQYFEKAQGSFYKFLIDYRVVRNFKKGESTKVFHKLQECVKSSNPSDIIDTIDIFARTLSKSGLIHDEDVPTSLASKVLFLHNPYKVFPLDKKVKTSLGVKSNSYTDYHKLLTEYIAKNDLIIQRGLRSIDKFATVLEQPYIAEFRDLPTIRRNRFIDKVLWIGLVDKEPAN